jgi:Skp family chaperone for outer membrane proteins
MKDRLNMNYANLRSVIFALAATAVMGLATISANAQQRIAVINLKSVFDGYWKTKQSDATVKERQNEFQTQRKEMTGDYEKANEEYRKLTESAGDQALSAEERARRKKAAESKLLEIKEIEQSIVQFDRRFQSEITDQIKRMRDNILREITDVVNAKARGGGYTLVLDTAAQSANQTPIVLFTGNTPDLSQEVLSELNAQAPPGALSGNR